MGIFFFLSQKSLFDNKLILLFSQSIRQLIYHFLLYQIKNHHHHFLLVQFHLRFEILLMFLKSLMPLMPLMFLMVIVKVLLKQVFILLLNQVFIMLIWLSIQFVRGYLILILGVDFLIHFALVLITKRCCLVEIDQNFHFLLALDLFLLLKSCCSKVNC